MVRVFMLFLLFPACSWAWTLTERCELTLGTPKGTVTVSPIPSGFLLYLPEGLVANDVWARVEIGKKSWRERVVGGAIELKGGAKRFLEGNWVTVHAEGEHVFGFSLSGSSTAWEKLQNCEPVSDGSGWVTLSGEITASTDDQVIGTIRRQQPDGLLLDSAGGQAEEAQRIGYAVRKAGMATKVEGDGRCLSECTFILAAGTPRTVEAGARVGVPPSLITSGLGVMRSERGSATDSAVYFSGMGVNGGQLAVLATSAKNEDIRTLTPAELRDLGLVDTSEPITTTAIISRRPSDAEGDGWWLLGGLLGIGALGWGLTWISNRS